MARTTEELTEQFRRLGAPQPEGWASSQAREGISQLHRYLFLRQAWSKIVGDDDISWIDREIAQAERRPDAPYAGVGRALKRLRANGAEPDELTEVVRGMQASLLFSFCYLLEDPEFGEEELQDIGWRLVETDSNGDPTGEPICSLHESVLETDPTGREMRPRPGR